MNGRKWSGTASGLPVPEASLENMQVIPHWSRKNSTTDRRCSTENAVPAHRVQDACHADPPDCDRGHGRRPLRHCRTSRPEGSPPFSSRREPRARAGTGPKCAPAAARAPFQTPHELQPSLPRSRTGRTHVPPGCVTSPDARMPLYPASATLPRCPERHRKTSRPRLSLLSADLRQGCNRRAIEDSLRIINHGVIRIPVKKT